MNLPFPTRFAYSSDQLRSQFGVVQDETRPDPAIHYKLIIPLAWRQLPIPPVQILAQTPFGQIGMFGSTTVTGFTASIRVAYIANEITPSDWLSVYAAQLGERVVQQRHTKQPGGSVPDVLTLSADEKTVSRWVVIKNGLNAGGAYLHALQVSIPVDYYTAEAANQVFAMIANFDYLHPGEWPYAERLRTLSRRRPLDFVLAYPESWQLMENPTGTNGYYQAQITRQMNGQEVSRINVAAVNQQTEPDMKRIPDLFLTAYKEQGILFEPFRFATHPLPFAGRAWMVQTSQLIGVPGEVSASTLTMLIAERSPVWLYMEEHTQSRQQSPEAWAIGKRAFEIIIDTLQIS